MRVISVHTAGSPPNFQFSGVGNDDDRPFHAAPANGDEFRLFGLRANSGI